MPKSPKGPSSLGKRVHADDRSQSNPSKNKKAKITDSPSDMPAKEAFQLISQLTKLEKQVEESRIEFQKFKETCIKEQDMKNAKFEAEIKNIKEIIDK